MRICLVHEEYPEETNFGGIATYQKVIAEEFIKLGHEVYVICRGIKEDKRYIENGVNVTRLFVKNSDNQVKDYIKYRQRVAHELLKLQNNNKIDIIEVPDWGAESILFEKNRRIPLVVRLHTPLKVWLKYNKNNFGKVKNKMLSWENKMINSADMVTCCSNALKKVIVSDFKIHESRIHVTPNPANITNFFRDESIEKKDVLLFVGSLEERKGVCVLANALNIIFKKHPNLKVKFIGKDTNRNIKNISTRELICNIVSSKYEKNLEFLGQIPNGDLNKYLNSAKIAVFPSLFDNFPYVVLEAMATGLHIVGSRNSGMVEMLDDDTYIYDTGNYKDLADKIIDKYEVSLKQEVNKVNINRLKKLYNPTNVCEKIITMYNKTINDYSLKNVFKKDLENVLSEVTSKNNIKSFKREKNGVANFVFRVVTKDKTYIIKKYVYNYDFDLSNELYELYEKAGIKVIRPINKNIIGYKSYNYNVFEYKKVNKFNRKIDIAYITKILGSDRETKQDVTILEKCMKYYEYLEGKKDFKDLDNQEVNYIMDIFENIKDEKMLKEKSLNHGDISKSNIIISKKYKYIIDFDEVTVTTPLYDFAVVFIKMLVKNKKINYIEFKKLKDLVKNKYPKYDDDALIKMIKFYLCKILIEKFYLHQIGKIDLYSKRQLKDSYFKYLEILKALEHLN